MRIGIFGSTGYIGGHLCAYFSNNSNMQMVAMDLNSQVNVDAIIISVGTLGNRIFYDNPLKVIESNHKLVLAILQKLLLQDYKNPIYFLSSYFVYGECVDPKTEKESCNPRGMYSVYKYQTEKLALEFAIHHNLTFHILRMSNILGHIGDPASNQHNTISYLLKKLKNQEDITLYGLGKISRNILMIEDFIHAIEIVLKVKNHPRIINIGSPNHFEFLRFFSLAKEIFKSKSFINLDENDESIDIRSAMINIDYLNQLGFSPNYVDASDMISKWNMLGKLID